MTETTKLMLNVIGRCLLGASAGTFIGAVGYTAIQGEKKIVNKILIAVGSVTTGYLVGDLIDKKFNELPPFTDNEFGHVEGLDDPCEEE